MGSVAVTSVDRGETKPWSRRQRKLFRLACSFLTYLQAQGHAVLWITLTSIVGTEGSELAFQLRALKKRIFRTFGWCVVVDVVRTTEGNGVLHLLMANKDGPELYIPQDWLEMAWSEINGANEVRVKPVSNDRYSRKNIPRYMVSQYMADQSAVARHYYSWRDLPRFNEIWQTYSIFGRDRLKHYNERLEHGRCEHFMQQLLYLNSEGALRPTRSRRKCVKAPNTLSWAERSESEPAAGVGLDRYRSKSSIGITPADVFRVFTGSVECVDYLVDPSEPDT